LETIIFRGYVSFREGSLVLSEAIELPKHLTSCFWKSLNIFKSKISFDSCHAEGLGKKIPLRICTENWFG